MTLILNQGTTPHVEIKTWGFHGSNCDLQIKIHYKLNPICMADISEKDMFELIKYYMTNTDLNIDSKDVRHEIVKFIKGLKIIDGYGKGNMRYGNK